MIQWVCMLCNSRSSAVCCLMTTGAEGREPQQLGISEVPAGECWTATSFICKKKKNYLFDFNKIYCSSWFFKSYFPIKKVDPLPILTHLIFQITFLILTKSQIKFNICEDFLKCISHSDGSDVRFYGVRSPWGMLFRHREPHN